MIQRELPMAGLRTAFAHGELVYDGDRPGRVCMNDWRHVTVEFSGRRRNVPFALLRGVECAGCDEERRVGKPCPQHYALGRTAQEAAEMVERWEQIVAEEGEPEPALRPWRLEP